MRKRRRRRRSRSSSSSSKRRQTKCEGRKEVGGPLHKKQTRGRPNPDLRTTHTRPPRWPSGKASASRAEDPGFQSRLRRDFLGIESYQ